LASPQNSKKYLSHGTFYFSAFQQITTWASAAAAISIIGVLGALGWADSSQRDRWYLAGEDRTRASSRCLPFSSRRGTAAGALALLGRA